MKRFFASLCLLGWIVSTTVGAKGERVDAGSGDDAGKPTATILVTPDKDWQEKWNTPQDTMPYFNAASEVGKGGSLFLITFFVNPGIDEAGHADLACDISLTAPDGTLAIRQDDVGCFSKATVIEPGITYMTDTTVSFEPDGTEPKGVWTYRVLLNDRIAGVVVPLETSFTVR